MTDKPIPDAAPALGERAELYFAIGAGVALATGWLLTYFEEFSQQQAAETLGISVKAVETRVYRARQKLAQMLDAPE